jgi:hypothetical protein
MTEQKKPRCKLTNTNGNIFALGARAGAALKKAGLQDKVTEMQHRIIRSHSYAEALGVIADYVDAR